jgi:hypothetical protein
MKLYLCSAPRSRDFSAGVTHSGQGVLVALELLPVDRGFGVRLSVVPASPGAVVEVLLVEDLPLAGGVSFVGELGFAVFVVGELGLDVLGALDVGVLGWGPLVVGEFGLGVLGVADAPVVGEAEPLVGLGTRTPAQ